MHFKELFQLESITTLTHISLVMFVAIFVGVLIWTFARTRRDVTHWANLPLEDGLNPTNASESKGKA